MASKYPDDEVMPRATEVLRIVLVGKTGSGKSASGNTILGHEFFESESSPTSVTDECSKATAKVDGQDVVVIDTPGLFDTSKDENTTCRHISQCICYARPGPHVFLIVISLGRYTKEEMKAVEVIQELFGEAAERYSMVLFTRGDDLKGKPIEEFIEKSPDLQDLIDRCQGQYHVFNNELKTGPQVSELLQKVRNIVENNGGSHYTSEMFQEQERAIEEEKQRILKEKEEEMRIKKEQLRREMQAELEEKLKDLEERKREDRDQMLNMFKKLNIQNSQNIMKMHSQLQQQKWEMERLKMEMQHRKELAKREKELLDRARLDAENVDFLRTLSERQLELTRRMFQEMHQREILLGCNLM